MKMLQFAAALAVLLGFVNPLEAASQPRVLKDATDAIRYARSQSKPLILFALIGSSEGSRHFAKLFNENKLKLQGDEFVVALCDASKRKNLTLFKNTFGMKLTDLPAVVITDPSGKPMAPSLQGLQVQDDYDRMVYAALLAAGLRDEDDPVISSTTGEVIEGSSEVFQLKKSDILDSLVVISDWRDWNLKDGESFHGALLKAEGSSGTFRVEGEKEDRRVHFNDLSEEDLDYLTDLLSGS